MFPPTSRGVSILVPGTCEYVTLRGKSKFADVIRSIKTWDGETVMIFWVGSM